MTRLAVLSDVHGNLPALDAVLADVRGQSVDGIAVAGDFASGPYPQETADQLRSLTGWMIRGNGENYCLAYDAGDVPEGWRESYQWAALRWSYEHLTRETLDYIASLPEQRVVAIDGSAPVRIVHGSPRSPSEHIFPNRNPAAMRALRETAIVSPDGDQASLDRALAQIDEPVLVCGHSHVPWQQEQDGRLVVNAGSVGAPMGGDPRAQYAILAWKDGRWRASHRTVPYDLNQIRAAYQETGFLATGSAFARACLLGVLTARDVPGFFIAHLYRLAAEVGCETGAIVPDDVWDRAVTTFDWPVVAPPNPGPAPS